MFYTKLHIEPFKQKIQYTDKIFFIGSCFSDEIAKYFKTYKFIVLSNPFGTMYNPVSIYQNISRIINKQYVDENDFFLDEDIYKSFDFHSSLAGLKLNELIEQINQLIETSNLFLKDVDWFFITFGTSYIYEHKKTNKIVANCHKQPSYEFNNRILSFDEIYNYFDKTISLINNFNTKTKIVITISPVRYLKYGAFENQVSKSLLFTALHKIRNKITDLYYFPSYEIFMDELRDYRYYASDLIHPSDVGIEYVWNRLIDRAFDENTRNIYNEIKNIINSCKHRPMFFESKTYAAFKSSLLAKIQLLEKQYSFLNFKDEKKLLI